MNLKLPYCTTCVNFSFHGSLVGYHQNQFETPANHYWHYSIGLYACTILIILSMESVPIVLAENISARPSFPFSMFESYLAWKTPFPYTRYHIPTLIVSHDRSKTEDLVMSLHGWASNASCNSCSMAFGCWHENKPRVVFYISCLPLFTLLLEENVFTLCGAKRCLLIPKMHLRIPGVITWWTMVPTY